MNPFAVLFDFDGVLVDSEPVYDRLTTELLQSLGVDPQPEFFDRLRGLRANDEWQLVRATYELELPASRLAALAEARRDALVANGPALPEIAGARQLVERLAAVGVPIAVVSSSPGGRVRAALQRMQLADRFLSVVGGDEVANGKPAPDGYLQGAAILATPPHRCVVIEDSNRGIESATAAGCASVHLASGGGHRDADLVVDDLRRLDPAILLDLVSGRLEA